MKDTSIKKVAGTVCSVVFVVALVACGDDDSGDGNGGSSGASNYIVSTLAGTGAAGAGNDPGLTATFNNPRGLAIGPDGSLYVADSNNRKIRKIAVDGTVSTFAGVGTADRDPDSNDLIDGDCASATFNSPNGVVVDAAGNVYVSDVVNTIRKITPAPTCQVTTLARGFDEPSALAVDASGNLYVADGPVSYVIKKITPDGTVTTIPGGTWTDAYNDPGYAMGMVLDPAGNIYVSADASYASDSYGHGIYGIQKIAPDGTMSALAGNNNAGMGDGTGANASFCKLGQMAIDASGNLYVNNACGAVRKVSPAGVVVTIAGSHISGTTGDKDGPGDQATFDTIGEGGVAVDGNGVVYLADTNNNKIRKIAPAP